jgi:hypothetical protein
MTRAEKVEMVLHDCLGDDYTPSFKLYLLNRATEEKLNRIIADSEKARKEELEDALKTEVCHA